MRIGFDGHVLTGKFQGTRTTVRNLLLSLNKLPHEHQILVYSDNKDVAERTLGETNFEHLEFKSNKSISRLILEIPSIYRSKSIDAFVYNYISAPFGRSVLFIHDILPVTHPRLFGFLFRWRSILFFSLSMATAWKIAAVSKYTAESIKKNFPRFISDKVGLVRNGPSFSEKTYFSEGSFAAERYILCVGRVEERKNIPLLVEAFEQAAVANVKLMIIGSNDAGFDYKIPSNKNIIQLTALDDEKLIDCYRGASLFIYPSRAEGFGLPLLDAILFGIPTISSNLCSMPEVAGELAEYFDPEEPAASDWLARRIRAHFEDAPVPKPTVAQRQLKMTEFSWDRAAQEFINLVA